MKHLFEFHRDGVVVGKVAVDADDLNDATAQAANFAKDGEATVPVFDPEGRLPAAGRRVAVK